MEKFGSFIIGSCILLGALAGIGIGMDAGFGGAFAGFLIGGFLGWIAGVNIVAYLPLLILLWLLSMAIGLCSWLFALADSFGG